MLTDLTFDLSFISLVLLIVRNNILGLVEVCFRCLEDYFAGNKQEWLLQEIHRACLLYIEIHLWNKERLMITLK